MGLEEQAGRGHGHSDLLPTKHCLVSTLRSGHLLWSDVISTEIGGFLLWVQVNAPSNIAYNFNYALPACICMLCSISLWLFSFFFFLFTMKIK